MPSPSPNRYRFARTSKTYSDIQHAVVLHTRGGSRSHHHSGEHSLCNHSSALLSPSKNGVSFSETSAWYAFNQDLSFGLNSEASTRFFWIGHCDTKLRNSQPET